jgi:hypothetical protein
MFVRSVANEVGEVCAESNERLAGANGSYVETRPAGLGRGRPDGVDWAGRQVSARKLSLTDFQRKIPRKPGLRGIE